MEPPHVFFSGTMSHRLCRWLIREMLPGIGCPIPCFLMTFYHTAGKKIEKSLNKPDISCKFSRVPAGTRELRQRISYTERRRMVLGVPLRILTVLLPFSMSK